MFFELVSIIVFAIVPDYGNEYMTKENKNFAPKLNLNHKIIYRGLYIYIYIYIILRIIKIIKHYYY